MKQALAIKKLLIVLTVYFIVSSFYPQKIYAKENYSTNNYPVQEIEDTNLIATAKANQSTGTYSNKMSPLPAPLVGPDFLAVLELIVFATFSLLSLRKAFNEDNKKAPEK